MSGEPPAGAAGHPSPAPAGYPYPARVAALVTCPVCGRSVPSRDGIWPYGHNRRVGGPPRLWNKVPCPDAVTPRHADVARGLTVRGTGT